jgi:hypothetical protein
LYLGEEWLTEEAGMMLPWPDFRWREVQKQLGCQTGQWMPTLMVLHLRQAQERGDWGIQQQMWMLLVIHSLEKARLRVLLKD